MSPTVFREGNYRFFFFSREESRKHIHVYSEDGEAKFWIEPIISLAKYTGYNSKQLMAIQKLIKEPENEIRDAWNKHFSN